MRQALNDYKSGRLKIEMKISSIEQAKKDIQIIKSKITNKK